MSFFIEKITDQKINNTFSDPASQQWNEFIFLIEEELGKRITDIWFRSLTLSTIRHDIKKISIKTPNKFVKEWLDKNYLPIIQKIFCRVLGYSSVDIELIFEGENQSKSNDPFIPASREQKIFEKKTDYVLKIKQNIQRSKIIIPSYLNPNFTFENFIVGEGNNIAHAAAKYLVENDTSWYNPLFIYGKSGMGKTHLIQAIGNSSINENYVCIYQTAEQFIQNYIQSVRSQSIDQFEKVFENIDVLLIDDIQSIAKKEQTQEIFLKIFNNLIHLKKKIVITANDIPKNIKGLIDRIQSRFESGLVIDLSLPCFDTLLKIINQKALIYNIHLNNEVMSYIAYSDIKNIRELEGMVTKLIAYSSLTKKELTSETLNALINYKPSEIGTNYYESKILNLIYKKCYVSLEDLKSKSRKKKIILARHLTMYLLRNFAKKTFTDIANFFNKKDHTTVMHACTKVEKAIHNTKSITQEKLIFDEIKLYITVEN